VIDGSPADKAGIQDGDIIVEFKGKKVKSPDELRELVAKQEIGDEIKVKVVRGEDSETLQITLGDWADQPAFAWSGRNLAPHMGRAMRWVSKFSHKQLGVRVSQVNEDLGSYFGVDEGEGVLVLSIVDESTAEAIGIKAGDVVVEVEGEEIQSAGDIRESLSDIDDGDEVNVTVVRKKKRVELKGEYKGNSNATWFSNNWQGHGPRFRAFAIPDDYKDELRKELDELREELEDLKKELKKS
jgi:serine protease Do